MKKRILTLLTVALLLVGLLAVCALAEEETTTVTFAPYTDADDVRKYCACGNKFVADEAGTIAYVNGENGCKNVKDENGNVTAGCDGTLITWSPISGSSKDLSGNAGKGFYLTGSTSLANANTCGAAGNYYIDLNGNLLYRNNSRVMTMVAGSNLYITDTSANKNGNLRCRNTDSKSHTGQGMVIWMNGENISVTLFAGNIDAEEPTSFGTGGSAIYCNKSTGKVNIFGGTVKAGTVTGGNAGVAMIGGSFNLYGGQVTGGSGVKGGAIYVGSSATLNISGGKIVGGTASNQGCAVYNDGTVNMSGGEIVRGTDTAQAVVYNVGNFTITGGTVDSTTAGASAQKGAIMTGTGSELTVNGGTVTGNPKSIYAYAATVNIQSGTVDGNQLYINGGSTINVTGGTVNQEIYLASGTANISGDPKITNGLNFKDTDQKVTIGTLTEGAELRVKTLGVADAVLPYYTLTDATALNYMYDNDAVRDLYWFEGEGLYVGKYNCAVCGGVYSGCDHAEKVKYTGVSAMPTASGNYYLTNAVEPDGQLSLGENVNVVLDLNGQTVSREGRIVGMSSAGATLTITDTSAEGSGTLKSTGAGSGQGKVVMVNNATAVLNLYAGTLDASESTNTNYGGAVSIIGTFNMYGGNVIGGGVLKETATSGYGFGGAISVGKASTFTMCGGTVTGGEAKYGGAIGLKNEAVAQITGGSVVSGKGTNGTAIYVNATSNLTVQNAAVVGGTSGTTIWNCGIVTLSGKVDMPAANFDIMIDCRNGESYLDVTGLTEVTDTISLRRWETDSTNDDAGLLAVNATESHVAMFEAKKADFYDIQLVEGQLVLAAKDVVIYGMNDDGEYLGAFADLADLSGASESITHYLVTKDLEGITVGSNIVLNLNGKHLTNVTVPETVELKLIDTANNGYDATMCGSLSGTINGTMTVLTQWDIYRYAVVVDEAGVYSAHRYYRAMSAISLDPTNDAFGYKAEFKMDDVLSGYVSSYGFELWAGDNNPVSYGLTVFANGTRTLRLKNIFANNGQEIAISGRGYITFTVGGQEYTTRTSTQKNTMKDVIKAVNDSWYNADGEFTYSQTQMDAVKALCDQYSEVTSAWELNNIYAVVEDTTTETTEPEETVSTV